MCEQDYRYYTCGCRKWEEFRQCEPVTLIRLVDSSHMCKTHMVKPGKDEMRR
ncbi:uncharacterized protein EKO05_0010373 [Ascochyta rabiei]|uniref:uncharacterized protein n=1 Tax=Didymella rabiei TaxID=5454 RepID=UPI0022048E52|nr:uncharacterized protein EKO05_0010373 [Ascochyta rabiei]UPX20129.1 hypothetical protein EKO05_0010373 [Ascochyta rabiei]